MVATLDPLHVPPRPWQTSGLDFPSHLHVSACFDSSVLVVYTTWRECRPYPLAHMR
jgi:hypothetical protein